MIPVFLLPLIAVFADASFLTMTKIFFRRYGKLTSREFVWLQFAGIVFVLLLVLPFFGQLPDLGQARSLLLLLLAVVGLAVAANLLFFWGIEHEKISEVEPFLLFNPLVAILIASAFYTDERIWPIYIAAGIASVVLFWSHFARHKFAFTKGLWAIIGFVVVYGLEASAIKTLLTVYDPVTLYFARSLLVGIVLSFVAPPKFKLIKPRHLAPFGIIGGLSVASVVAAYTAFQLRGLTETIFIFTLSPILVYLASVIFLREKWRFKNIVASIIIVILIVWVSLMK